MKSSDSTCPLNYNFIATTSIQVISIPQSRNYADSSAHTTEV